MWREEIAATKIKTVPLGDRLLERTLVAYFPFGLVCNFGYVLDASSD
jgi:hypothetical protein